MRHSAIQIISIHALREESDEPSSLIYIIRYTISIHALREESDRQAVKDFAAKASISIHALREESDNGTDNVTLTIPNFNPRSP